MELHQHNQEKILKAIKENRTDAYNLTTILKAALLDLLPKALLERIELRDNADLPSQVKAVSAFSEIPWIDTSKALFIELPSTLLTSESVREDEAKKLCAAGFPSENIPAVFVACQAEDTLHEQRALQAGEAYVRSETFLFACIRPEDDHGVLVTEMDNVKQRIYSNATDVPVNSSLRHQYTHFKSVLTCLLQQLPDLSCISTFHYAYYIPEKTNRLFLFISVK